jgi:hypothetical protein
MKKKMVICKLLLNHGIFLMKTNDKLIARDINLRKHLFETTGDLTDMRVTRVKDGKVALFNYKLASDFEDRFEWLIGLVSLKEFK